MTETLDPSYAGDGLYREHILDHYKSPRNAGTLEHPTVTHKEFNPLCGDELTFTLLVKDSTVEDVKFQGRGCAISQAAASMLTDRIKGEKTEAIKKLVREDILELLGIPIGPARTKCAMLGLVTVKRALEKETL